MNNMRPETMARIETPAQAEAFIAEQVAAVRAQVGDRKVLLALSGGVDSFGRRCAAHPAPSASSSSVYMSTMA